MSLFGDDDDGFGSKTSAPAAASQSLFADDDEAGGESPWGMPTPKKASRSDLVKNLLSGATVPESYIDAFDTLLRAGEATGSNVSAAAVTKLLQGSGLGAAEQERILELVAPGGTEASGLGRGQFNVLLALIGLAQEGDEATLDGVDERRRSLPTPNLAYVDKLRTSNSQNASSDAPAPAAASNPARTTPPKTRTARQDSLTNPETDPWASPVGARAPPPQQKPPVVAISEPATAPRHTNLPGRPGLDSTARTTSNFTTGHSSAQQVSGAAGGGWGGEEVAGFGGSNPVISPGGFGEATNPLEPPRRTNGGGRAAEEHISVTVMPEKEGMFLFQHHNYEVKSLRRGSAVVRRYSDFVWLLDCLHKRYPFRQLPLLPPKTLAVNGRHLSSDRAFLEKRRRGLLRFINALARHPILREEQLVVMFLTVPTELSVWRKQANLSVQDEFSGKALPPGLEDSLPTNLAETLDTVRDGVTSSAEAYITLCALLERLAGRKRGLAADFLRFATTLRTVAAASEPTYAIETNDVPLLNAGLGATARHLETSTSLLEDEARAWDDGVLEDLKRQRDDLVSVRDMFERRDRLARNSIPQLERRIEANEAKLGQIRARADGGKPGEAEKVEQAIVSDKQSIVEQHARGVFIRECLRDELRYFQQSQFHVSRLHQDWSQEQVKYAELAADNWRALSDEVEHMPLGD